MEVSEFIEQFKTTNTTTYKLIKWYSNLPRKWNVGDIFEYNKKYGWLHNTKMPIISYKVSIDEVYKYPECWQKIKL